MQLGQHVDGEVDVVARSYLMEVAVEARSYLVLREDAKIENDCLTVVVTVAEEDVPYMTE